MIEKLEWKNFWSEIHASDDTFAGGGDKATERHIQTAKILLLESALELIINEIIRCRFNTDSLRKKLTRDNKINLLYELTIITEDEKKDLLKIKEIRDLFGHHFAQTGDFIQEVESKIKNLAYYKYLESVSSVLDCKETIIDKFIISTSNFLNNRMGKAYDQVYEKYQSKSK